jgi:hypothetical protein
MPHAAGSINPLRNTPNKTPFFCWSVRVFGFVVKTIVAAVAMERMPAREKKSCLMGWCAVNKGSLDDKARNASDLTDDFFL